MAKIVIKVRSEEVREVLNKVREIFPYWRLHYTARGSRIVNVKIILDEEAEVRIESGRRVKVKDILKERGLTIKDVFEKIRNLGLPVELEE